MKIRRFRPRLLKSASVAATDVDAPWTWTPCKRGRPADADVLRMQRRVSEGVAFRYFAFSGDISLEAARLVLGDRQNRILRLGFCLL